MRLAPDKMFAGRRIQTAHVKRQPLMLAGILAADVGDMGAQDTHPLKAGDAELLSVELDFESRHRIEHVVGIQLSAGLVYAQGATYPCHISDCAGRPPGAGLERGSVSAGDWPLQTLSKQLGTT